MKTTAERIAAVVREDVRAMHAYPVQASAGLVKLDAMENRSGCPTPCSASSASGSAGWPSTAIQVLRSAT